MGAQVNSFIWGGGRRPSACTRHPLSTLQGREPQHWYFHRGLSLAPPRIFLLLCPMKLARPQGPLSTPPPPWETPGQDVRL